MATQRGAKPARSARRAVCQAPAPPARSDGDALSIGARGGPEMTFYKRHAPHHREHQRPLAEHVELTGYRAQDLEAALPTTQWQAECRRGQELGLSPAESIEDKSEISCFQRGELPHWSGI